MKQGVDDFCCAVVRTVSLGFRLFVWSHIVWESAKRGDIQRLDQGVSAVTVIEEFDFASMRLDK